MSSKFILVACACAALAACAPKAQQPIASPGAVAQFAYVVVPSPAPQAAAPKILEVALFGREYHAPGPVGVRIRTSSDVTSVTARLMGRERGVPKIADGVFQSVAQLPDVPFFLKGRDYTVQFVASTDDGRTASTEVTVHLDR